MQSYRTVAGDESQSVDRWLEGPQVRRQLISGSKTAEVHTFFDVFRLLVEPIHNEVRQGYKGDGSE